MYRDDTCAVCGESLPPDHLYCREHAAGVDDRLNEIGALLDRVTVDLPRLAELLNQVAPDTYDWLAADEPDEPDWPPPTHVTMRLRPEDVDVDVDVDVDSEPGQVRATLRPSLATLLDGIAPAVAAAEVTRFARRCATARGANATH